MYIADSTLITEQIVNVYEFQYTMYISFHRETQAWKKSESPNHFGGWLVTSRYALM